MVFKKGFTPWNKGLTKEIDERVRNYGETQKGWKHTSKTKKKMSENHPNMSKENNPMFGKNHLPKSRKKMSKAQLRRKERDGYINSPRSREKMGESRLGEKNPNWNGGKSFEPYDKTFNNKFRRDIRERDNQICMLCSIHREKLKRALAVHHIDYDKLNTTKENCISLCINCHSKTNGNRKHWVIFFQSLLNEKYGYEYE